jgi:hypothetical protein
MSNLSISEMPDASALDGTELVPLVQSGGNVKTTTTDLLQQSATMYVGTGNGNNALYVYTGDNSSGVSGSMNFYTGNSDTGDSGAITLTTGTADGTRGNIVLDAPTITSTATEVDFASDIVFGSDTGEIDLQGTTKVQVYTLNSAGNSGSAVISTGNAASGNSGDITLKTGTASGTRGNIILTDLPTADPHIAGALWNSSGVLHVSAG